MYKKTIITIWVILILAIASITYATTDIPITVPTAPGANYVLMSTTTGKYVYVATSSLGITGGGGSATTTGYLRLDQSTSTQYTAGAFTFPYLGVNLPISANNRFEVTETNTFTLATTSPNIFQTHQGYTTDGTYHYTIHTDAFYKRNNDATWSVAASNTDPFNGLTGYNHLGDGTYYNGKLYIASETYTYPGANHQSVFIFNATTLAREQVIDLSATALEVSSVAISPDLNIMFVADYDHGLINKYDLTTYAYLGQINPSPAVANIQGVAFKNGLLYLSANTGLYTMELNGSSTQMATPGFAWPVGGAPEGIDYNSNQLRILFDGALGGSNSFVYSFNPLTIPSITATKSGNVLIGATSSIAKLSVSDITSATNTPYGSVLEIVQQNSAESNIGGGYVESKPSYGINFKRLYTANRMSDLGGIYM